MKRAVSKDFSNLVSSGPVAVVESWWPAPHTIVGLPTRLPYLFFASDSLRNNGIHSSNRECTDSKEVLAAIYSEAPYLKLRSVGLHTHTKDRFLKSRLPRSIRTMEPDYGSFAKAGRPELALSQIVRLS